MSYQTYTLEYRVPGALDGSTLSEAFEAGSVLDPEQLHIFEPAQLGLIDLTFQGQRSPRANRYAHWFYLYNYSGALNDVLASVARYEDPADPSIPIVEVRDLVIQIDPLQSIVYSRQCFFIPQGYLLRLRTAGRADESQDTVVRIGVFPPETQQEEILIRRAKCCLSGIPDQRFEICDPPVLTSFSPPVEIINNPTETFTVTIVGTGFTDTDNVTLTRTDPDDGAVVAAQSVSINPDGDLEAQFSAEDITVTFNSTWTISVFRANDPTCSDSLPGFQTEQAA